MSEDLQAEALQAEANAGFTGQEITAEHRAIADKVCKQVAGRLKGQVSAAGVGDDLLERAKYIVRNKMISAGVPVWAVEMLMEGVERALEQLLKPARQGET